MSSKRAFKKWLYERLDNALNEKPASFPQDATSGVMYRNGFTSEQVAILIDRPARYVNAKRNAVLIINVPVIREKDRTAGGAQGKIKADFEIELDILWVADFSPNQDTGEPATYTDETESNEDFDTLVESVAEALRLTPYVYYQDSPTIPSAKNWVEVDDRTGQKITIMGEQPKLEILSQEAVPAEDGKDLYYGALIRCNFYAEYRAIP